jgi:hypothetical protein
MEDNIRALLTVSWMRLRQQENPAELAFVESLHHYLPRSNSNPCRENQHLTGIVSASSLSKRTLLPILSCTFHMRLFSFTMYLFAFGRIAETSLLHLSGQNKRHFNSLILSRPPTGAKAMAWLSGYARRHEANPNTSSCYMLIIGYSSWIKYLDKTIRSITEFRVLMT